MRTPIVRASSLVFCLCALACSGTVTEPEDPQGGDDGSSGVALGSPGATNNPKGWESIQPCPDGGPDDDIDVKAVEVDGDLVTITAGHSAGCASHTYGLCYENEWAESYPVQIGLRLMHDAHGETCEAYEELVLEFDLSPLQSAYNDAYRTESGTVRLGLPGHSFLYSFGELARLEWSDVQAAIDEANTCDTVTDCQGISIYPCDTAYVNADANISALTSMIDSYFISKGGYGDIGCDDSCACGALTCEAGKCVTTATNCETPAGEGQRDICL